MQKTDVRLYSAISEEETVQLRQLDSDDREVDEHRNVPAESGRWVIDANYDGRHKTVVDLQDLLLHVERSEPGLIERLLASAARSPKEAFERLVALNTRVQAEIGAARGAKATDYDPFEIAYDNVFNASVSGTAHELCRVAGLTLDWYDPDTSYEDDVCSFARGLDELVTSRKPYFDALPD